MKLEKVTDRKSSARRLYDDACGTALALEFVGERWSLLVMRELVFGPRRFGQIKANLPGVSANVLTQRLGSLIEAGIVVRRLLPAPASVQVYDLTDWGRGAAPVMRTLGAWAARSPRHDPLLFMSPASAMMSLQTLGDAGAAPRGGMTVAFRFPEDAFEVRVADGTIQVARGEAADPEVVFTGDTMAMRRTIYGKAPFSAEGQGGTLAIAGDMKTAQAFVDLFRLPEKIAS